MVSSDEDYIRRHIERLAGHKFALKAWSPSAALFPVSGNGASAKYDGQAFDPAEYKLVEEGWSHDHCPFCWVTICDHAYEGSITEAYTDGYNWVCAGCFSRHLGGKVAP